MIEDIFKYRRIAKEIKLDIIKRVPSYKNMAYNVGIGASLHLLNAALRVMSLYSVGIYDIDEHYRLPYKKNE